MLTIKIANTFVEIIDSHTGYVVCSDYNPSDSTIVAYNYEKLLKHLGLDSNDYKILNCKSSK